MTNIISDNIPASRNLEQIAQRKLPFFEEDLHRIAYAGGNNIKIGSDIYPMDAQAWSALCGYLALPVTIQESSPPRTNYTYETLIKSVKLDRRKNLLKVVLKKLNASQYGRPHTILLPLPACPGNPTCLFLEACGFGTNEIGKEIDLDSLIGKQLKVQFLRHQPPYDHRSVRFTKLKESSSHGNIAK